MKIWLHLVRADLQRGFFSAAFFLSIIFMVSVGLLSGGSMLFSKEYSVCEIVSFLFAGSGSADLIILVFPLLPFSLTYARDEQERCVGFWIVRSGTKKYIHAKFVVSCMIAFFSVFLFFLLLTMILLLKGHPLYHSDLEYVYEGYDLLLATGHPVVYLFMYFIHYSLGGALTAACAVWISTISPSWFLALTGPICLNYIALRLISFPYGEEYVKYDFFRVENWVQGICVLAGGVWPTFLARLGAVLFVCAVFDVLSIYNVKRRWHDA